MYIINKIVKSIKDSLLNPNTYWGLSFGTLAIGGAISSMLVPITQLAAIPLIASFLIGGIFGLIAILKSN